MTRMHKRYRDKSGKIDKLPYRVSKKTLKLATEAGRAAA